MKATVSRHELQAAMLFVSADESRYVLSGICLKYRPGEKPLLVATDGRRLAVIESVAEQEDDIPEFQEREIIIRSDFAKAVCSLSKAVGGKLFPWIAFENKPGSQRCTVAFVGGKCWLESEDTALIDSTYPDWRQVLPPRSYKREPMSEIGLNSEFVGDYAKVAKILEAESPVIQMSLVGKESSIEIKVPACPNFYGLVMQTRLQEGVDYQPEFLGIVQQLPKAETKPQEETGREDGE